MGFRDYIPGLNRFLTRDSYNEARRGLVGAGIPAGACCPLANVAVALVEVDSVFAICRTDSAVPAVRRYRGSNANLIGGLHARDGQVVLPGAFTLAATCVRRPDAVTAAMGGA
jgi:hypothetical protein